MSGEQAAEPLFELTDVGKTYGQTIALADVNLTIQQGEYIALTGPSGSGKSTLMHLVAALQSPTVGEIRFRGDPLTVNNADSYRSDGVGLVFQNFELLPTLTAVDNVQTPLLWKMSGVAKRRALALEVLEKVGLAERANHLPGQMSGGEQQRVAIARALVSSPKVLLADEPTGNLDSKNSEAVLELLEGLHKDSGFTLIMVTHDANIANRAGRQIEIVDGRVVSQAVSLDANE